MKSKKYLFLCFGAMLLLLSSCYPDGPDSYSDLDTVYTNHLTGYDFSSKNTYAIPDKIVVDVEEGQDGVNVPVYMDDVFAIPILNSIEENMSALGWTKVSLSESPDVLLTPAGVKSTTIFYSYWYDWWYGGGYGWYYPPYYTVSSYTTGTLIMVVSDPNVNGPTNESPAVWVGVLSGLVSWDYDASRVLNGINQAFKQSSYLNTK